MRDYRGKRADNGEWIYGSLLDGDIIVAGPVDVDEDYIGVGEWSSVDLETVGQYTGLNDTQNTELYHHDLWEYLNVVYVVSWHPDEARFYFKHPNAFASDDDNIELQWATHGTKVGNIHDNPELLGEVRE